MTTKTKAKLVLKTLSLLGIGAALAYRNRRDILQSSRDFVENLRGKFQPVEPNSLQETTHKEWEKRLNQEKTIAHTFLLASETSFQTTLPVVKFSERHLNSILINNSTDIEQIIDYWRESRQGLPSYEQPYPIDLEALKNAFNYREDHEIKTSYAHELIDTLDCDLITKYVWPNYQHISPHDREAAIKRLYLHGNNAQSPIPQKTFNPKDYNDKNRIFLFPNSPIGRILRDLVISMFRENGEANIRIV